MRPGRKTDVERNAAFLWDWMNAKHGDRQRVADKYGFASLISARVIAHRLRTLGRTSPRLDTDK